MLRYKKRWHVYSFVALFSILPNSFGIKYSGQVIPFNLIYLFICFFIGASHKHWRIKFNLSKKEKLVFLIITLCLFIPLITTLFVGYSSVYELILYTCFTIVLFFYINSYAEDKEDILNCFRFLSLGASVLFAVALINSVLRTDISECLNMASRDTYITLADRLNFTRVRTTYNSITFGYYCAFLQPVFIILYQNSKRIRYIILAIVGVLCCAMTTTRGALLIIAVYYLTFALKKKKLTGKNIFRIACIIFGLCIALYVVSRSFPDLWNHLQKVVEITINAFNSSYKNVYVNNNNALGSRTVQFTIIKWLAKNSRLFIGFGFDANSKELIRYYVNNAWVNYKAVDAGYPAMLGIGGLFHLIAYGGLFIIMLKNSARKYFEDKSDFNFMIFILVFLLIIGNFATVFYRDNIAALIIVLLITAIKKRRIKTIQKV